MVSSYAPLISIFQHYITQPSDLKSFEYRNRIKASQSDSNKSKSVLYLHKMADVFQQKKIM
jgi:hypothetical protein